MAKLIVGNWKMNGRVAGLAGYAAELKAAGLAQAGVPAELVVCPPAPLLPLLAEALAGGAVAVGAQDCHVHASGAHTGDLSPVLLAEVGCRYVIVGHSERRQDHHETDELVAAKATAALAAGLVPIVCVGETAAERAAGQALARVAAQVAGSVPADAGISGGADLVVAYEPVWAIGSGATPTPAEIAEVHGALRACLARGLGRAGAESVRLLYGGSVKPGNAAELLATPDVDGALVGGASLAAADFWAICRSVAGRRG